MEPHREEFLHLAHVSDDRALITWGAFFFKPHGGELELMENSELAEAPIDRPHGCIGADTDSYGPATVRVWRHENGARAEPPAATLQVDGPNFVWAKGLRADTAYEYEVSVGGRVWGGSPADFSTHKRKGRFTPAQWRYRNVFRTFPAPDGAAQPVAFVVIGDPGTGKDTQYDIAARLEAVIDAEDVRFIVTTGDNVYGRRGVLQILWDRITGADQQTGNEDDDWFDTFYHPYRRIINRTPVFPALGNHDTSETENAADLPQQMDNFYLPQRFPGFAERWKNPNGVFHTLFYTFRCGPDLEMVALDTGRPRKDPAFERPEERAFIDRLLHPAQQPRGWQIPFSHHPPYSVGPSHPHEPNVQNLGNLFTGLDSFRLWLSGHEHNFQHHRIGQIHYVVSGAAGKLDTGVDATRVQDGGSCCHGERPHFLLVKVDGARLTLRAIGADGRDIPRAPLSDFPPHADTIEISL